MSILRSGALAAIALGSACGEERDAPPKTPSPTERQGTGTLAGVWPERWTCELVATVDQVGQIVGGRTSKLETQFPTPPGVAKPCNYLARTDAGEEAWTFDVDCRDDYKRRADALFAQYGRTSRELVAAYNEASDAAPTPVVAPPPRKGPPPDAAPPRRAPESSHEVAVGARGLDHHGQGLLFIDDDAPCYVRVVGPSADRRLALSQHIVQHLTFKNAPMTPRAAP